MAEVAFEFGIEAHGWIDGIFAIDGQRAKVTASYLSDGPGELLTAVTKLTRTSETARVSWETEPGEYRWVFDRAGDTVRVRVLWFEQILEGDDDGGDVLADGRCSLWDLVDAIATAARRVLAGCGEIQYRKSWEHRFPTTQLSVLEGWLAAH